MNYNDFFEKAKEKEITNLEILENTTEKLVLETFDDSVDNHEISNLTTYQISGMYNKKKVIISTEILDDSTLDKLMSNASYIDEDSKPSTNDNQKDIVYKANYNLTSPKEIINRLLALNNFKTKYSTLSNINAMYEENISQIKIITQNSIKEDIKKRYDFGVEIVATKNDQKSTYFDYKLSTNNDINMEQLTEEIIQNAISKLECGNIESGTYNVLLEHQVVAQILDKFIPIFTAESIQKHTSILEGKLNQEVFSKLISIVEDPTNENMVGKRLFDDAGIKTTYKEIIKNGVFKTVLYDEKTANLDNKFSTANSYNGTISVRNMYIKPGEKELKDILKEQTKCIIIDTIYGMHAGINITNGDISLQSDGYLLENGHKTPLRLFIISTNIIDLLNNVIEVANDLEMASSNIGSPSILVKNVNISM